MHHRLRRSNAIESFDTSVVKARSLKGISFSFCATHTCRAVREPEIFLDGTTGRVEWKHERSCIVFHAGGRSEERRLPNITANRQSRLAATIEKLKSPETVICNTALAEQHTAFVEAVHAAATVRTVPASLIDWDSSTPGLPRVPVVAGLEAGLVRAFENKCLLHEAGFILPLPALV